MKPRNISIGEAGTLRRQWLVIAATLMAAKLTEEAKECAKLQAPKARNDLEQRAGAASALVERIGDAEEEELPFVGEQIEIMAEGLRRVKKRLDAIQGTLRGVGWIDIVERAEQDAEHLQAEVLPAWDDQLTLA